MISHGRSVLRSIGTRPYHPASDAGAETGG